MSFPQLASSKECTACGACIAVCNKKALNKVLLADGHYYISLDKSRCVQCGICENTCPVLNRTGIGSNELGKTLPHKGWSLLPVYRNQGTSGGVFGAIAYDFILKGGIVIGVMLAKNHCKHIAIERVEDIHLLQGSKYMYSDLSDIYAVIKQGLKENRKILFSGLPCQVAGVLAVFSKNPKRDLLFTIDLVCGGIPSTLLKDSFLQKYPNTEICSFRKKEIYDLSIIQNGKAQQMGAKNLMIAGFLSGLANRYSCYDCKYAKAHRLSDITLGDYWQKNVTDGKGVSLLLYHNERAKSLVSNKYLYLSEVKWEDFLQYNPKIVVGKIPWQNRWERKYLPKLANSTFPYYLRNLIYASAFKKYDVFGIIYLMYKRIRKQIEQHRRLLVVRNILQHS